MKRLAFTMIELVFIIVILGILAAVAIPKMIMNRDDACYAKLRANLSEAQSDISREATRAFMKGSTLDEKELRTILQDTLGADSSNQCRFAINDNFTIGTSATNLGKMVVGKNELTIKIARDSSTKTPIISCDKDSNDSKTKTMCRTLLNIRDNK